MGRGFHWFEGLEWAFVLFLVLLALGVAADGFSERGALGVITSLFFIIIELAAVVLSIPAALVGFASGLGAMVFFLLFFAGLWFFRFRVLELSIVALIALFAISVLFGGIY